MDPPEDNYLPPPAYCEQEFDQKTIRATELSLRRAKWEAPKLDLDDEGFPRYDPAMFEDGPSAQKGKEQPTTTALRSSSINKRPLPKPTLSSNNAGPSTLRQTAPLHISKKSISKAEDVARDAAWNIPASSQEPEDYPPYVANDLSVPTSSLPSTVNPSSETRSEDNPLYAASHVVVSTPSLPPIPDQSIEDTPEDNPPYTDSNFSAPSRQSISNQNIRDVENNPPYTANSFPAPSRQSVPSQDIRDMADNLPYTASSFPAPSRQSIPSQDIRDMADNPPYTASSFPAPSRQSIPSQNIRDMADNPPYTASSFPATSRQSIPSQNISSPYTANNLPAPSRQFLPNQNIRDVEDNPPDTVSSFPASSRQSIPSQNIRDMADGPPYTASNLPVPSRQFIPSQNIRDMENNPPYAAWNVDSLTTRNVADTPEDNSPYATRNFAVTNPSLQSIPNQRVNDTPEDNPPYEADYSTGLPYDEQPVDNLEEGGATPRQEVAYGRFPNSPFDRPQSVELPQHPMRRRELVTPNNTPMNNRMLNASQHFSLPPPPRRIITPDRPRSHFTVSSPTLSQPSATPRVLFNPKVAYGENPMGGLPQFRPKAQPPQMTPFNPHLFYNSAVSSQLKAPTTMPDESLHSPYHQAQRPQVWPSQTYSSPARPTVNQNQSLQWRWHPDGPSNTYRSAPDPSYNGGPEVSRYPHYPVANNAYYNP